MSMGAGNGFSTTRLPPVLRPMAPLRLKPLLLLLLACLSGALVLFVFDPSQSSFYPRCWFHQATGLWCPGCGTLRALHHLLHGQLLAALHSNALLVLGLAGLGWHLGRAILARQPLRVELRSRWLWAGCVLLVVFGVARNVPLGPLVWLSP
jgi:hypothetical protein